MMNNIINIFERKMTLEEMQAMNEYYMNHEVKKYSVVRHLQIINDSIKMCLSSKNNDTAFSRFELLDKTYRKEVLPNKNLLTNDEFQYVAKKMNEVYELFPKKVYLNVALGFEAKASKMKSNKGKLKYLNLAIDSLKDGLKDARSDKPKLKAMLDRLDSAKNSM